MRLNFQLLKNPKNVLTMFKSPSSSFGYINSNMATEHSTSNDLKNEIAYLEYQQYSINVNLESLRQELQGIDFFFANFGYYYKYNVVTQMMINQRNHKEDLFDKICTDSYEINRALAAKREELENYIKPAPEVEPIQSKNDH